MSNNFKVKREKPPFHDALHRLGAREPCYFTIKKNKKKQRQKLDFGFALNISKIHIEIIFFISFRNIIVCKQTIIEISRLRSRWRVGSFSLKSIVTWTILFYTLYFKISYYVFLLCFFYYIYKNNLLFIYL